MLQCPSRFNGDPSAPPPSPNSPYSGVRSHSTGTVATWSVLLPLCYSTTAPLLLLLLPLPLLSRSRSSRRVPREFLFWSRCDHVSVLLLLLLFLFFSFSISSFSFFPGAYKFVRLFTEGGLLAHYHHYHHHHHHHHRHYHRTSTTATRAVTTVRTCAMVPCSRLFSPRSTTERCCTST